MRSFSHIRFDCPYLVSMAEIRSLLNDAAMYGNHLVDASLFIIVIRLCAATDYSH